MASFIGVPHLDHRPGLHRSRSHSTPEQNGPSAPGSQSAIEHPTRPSHGRSHSYLSPIDPKPRNAATLPTPSSTLEKASSRLHLPGSSKHHDSSKRQRYTQSEVEKHHRLRKDDHNDSMRNLVAGLNAEKKRHPHGNEFGPAPPGGLTRMMSSRSYRGMSGPDSAFIDVYGRQRNDGAYYNELRRRNTTDTRQPGGGAVKKSAIEADLERADRVRRQRRFTLTKSDIVRKDKEIEVAEDEMREALEDVNRTGMEITRRLDYGYYNLLEKIGNLVGTIQSFQTLAEQSKQLVVNFEHESERLDGDMRRRLEKFKDGFEQREKRVEGMEERGSEVARKAADLGQRMDKMRVMIENWERREDRSRKKWGRFWGMCWSMIALFLVLIVGLVMWKEWWFRGDPVKAGLNLQWAGHRNGSLMLGDGGKGDGVLRRADMPEEVRAILAEIGEKNKVRKGILTRVEATDDVVIPPDEGEEKLRVLDEL